MIFLIIFLISLTLAIFLTPYLITYFENIGVVDKPGKRRINTKTIPRMGGIVLYLILTIIIICFYQDIYSIKYILITSFLIVICGVIDDIIGLKWKIKFPVQFLSAFLIIAHYNHLYTSVNIFGILLPTPINYIVTVFFIVGVLNAINLMDGLDGLVSGFSLIVFSIILVLSLIRYDSFLIITELTLIGSILGFLKFNSYPAKIFLGDTGSLFLGLYIIISLFQVTLKFSNNVLDLTFPIILLSIPIIDTLKVMLKRIFNKKNPFLPDKTHLHHIILGKQIRHKITVFLILGLALVFVIISLYYLKYRSVFSILLFIIGTLIIVFMDQIMNVLMKVNVIRIIYKKLVKLPFYIYHLFDKCIIYASVPPILYILQKNYSNGYILGSKEFKILLFANIIIFLLAYLHYRKTKILHSLYVYFNIVFFFFFNFDQHLFNNIFINYLAHENLIAASSLAVISVFELLFLLSRGISKNKKDMFFNGFDLTIIILTELIVILPNFFSTDYLFSISCNILVSFIIYFMYKIIVFIKKEIKKPLFYSSFLLPLSILIYSLIIK